MKILIVGFSASIHTARWINQLQNIGWEIKLFSSVDNGATHEELKNITIFHTFYGRLYNRKTKAKVVGIPVFSHMTGIGLRLILQKIAPYYHRNYLARVIKRFKPDIVHSMEIQHAGYLVNEVKKRWRGRFPTWIVTNWGSDIYLFGRFPEHKEKITATLQSCDFYSCECHRDIALGQHFGFNKKVLPVLPNSSGFNLEKIINIRNKIRPSRRKIILVKGYQGWAGRALVALHALDQCGKLLQGYTLIIYAIQEGSGVDIAARLLAQKYNLKLIIIPRNTPHKSILQYYSQARIAIGLGISDAISTMVLESMVMGAFPIQSNTSCANEWITHNKTGMIVPPEDPSIVAKAIRRALSDDKLVDQGARQNWLSAQKSLDQTIIHKQIIKFYEEANMNKQRFFITGIFGSGKTTFAKKYAKEHNLKFISFDKNFNYRLKQNQSQTILDNLPPHCVMDAIPIDEKSSWDDFKKFEQKNENISVICVYCPHINTWLKRVGKRAKFYHGLQDGTKYYIKKIIGRNVLPKNIESLKREYRNFFKNTLPALKQFKSIKYFDTCANEYTTLTEMLKRIKYSTFVFQEYLDKLPSGYDKYYQDIEVIGLVGYSESYKTWNAIKSIVCWKNKRVVDLGCSHGYFSFKAEDQGAKVLALEKSASVVKTTKWINKLRNGRVKIHKWEGGEQIPACDIILCLNVLHHFPDPEKVLCQMKCKRAIFEIYTRHKSIIQRYMIVIKELKSQRSKRIILLCRPKKI